LLGNISSRCPRNYGGGKKILVQKGLLQIAGCFGGLTEPNRRSKPGFAQQAPVRKSVGPSVIYESFIPSHGGSGQASSQPLVVPWLPVQPANQLWIIEIDIRPTDRAANAAVSYCQAQSHSRLNYNLAVRSEVKIR